LKNCQRKNPRRGNNAQSLRSPHRETMSNCELIEGHRSRRSTRYRNAEYGHWALEYEHCQRAARRWQMRAQTRTGFSLSCRLRAMGCRRRRHQQRWHPGDGYAANHESQTQRWSFDVSKPTRSAPAPFPISRTFATIEKSRLSPALMNITLFARSEKMALRRLPRSLMLTSS
jgi:hypothetical protein